MNHQDAKLAEQRNLVIAIAITSSIMSLEFIGGILSNSLALLSDAWHMFADLMALTLCYIAGSVSTKPPTKDKTYGFYRIEILSALLNGILLVIVAIFIFTEAFERILSTQPIHSIQMLFVASIGLAANLISMSVISRRMLSLNIRAAFLHVLGDALSSIGVIVGAIIIYFTGIFIVDSLIGILIGVIIVYGTIRMLRITVHILLEGAPRHISTKLLIQRLKSIEGVKDIHDLHIWSITSYIHVLTAHLVLDPNSRRELNDLLNEIKIMLKKTFGIEHSTLQIEKESYEETGQICQI